MRYTTIQGGPSGALRINRPRRWARWLGRNWARLSYGRQFEPRWLELNVHHLHLQDLPPSFGGYRIVHLSDFHAGQTVCPEHLARTVELANEQQPDLVALTGDFIHAGPRFIDPVARVLGRLKARDGVLAVLGNHDFAVRNALGLRFKRSLHSVVEKALRGQGVTVLRNQSLTLERGGFQLHLIGVDDLWSGGCDVAAAFGSVRANGPRVVLAHNPCTIEHLCGEHCDLMLSGHTHGGQINWPGVGRFLLSRTGRRYAAGLYSVRNSLLYVNRGVGHGFRFRFGARPEVAVLHLWSGSPPKVP